MRPTTAFHSPRDSFLLPLARFRTFVWMIPASLLWLMPPADGGESLPPLDAATGTPEKSPHLRVASNGEDAPRERFHDHPGLLGTAEGGATTGWEQLAERGWFSLARQAADNAPARRVVAEAVRAVDEANRRRTSWLEQTKRWRLVWHRSETGVASSQADRLVALGSQHGLHLVSLASGQPVWGDGPGGGGPLFPRLRPAMQSTPFRPSHPGPVVIAASRLVGLVDRPLAGSSLGPLLAVLDLAPAAEGRLVWTHELPSNLVPSAAGLTATASACYLAWPDADAGTLELISLAVADGGLRWRRTWPLVAGFEKHLKQPVLVASVQHLVVVALPGGVLVALAADTGSERWRMKLPAMDAAAGSEGIIDILATTADKLLVLRRPAAGGSGIPEIYRLCLLSGTVSKPYRPTADSLAMAGDNPACGPPLVRGGHVLWPVSQSSAAPAQWLLVCRLPIEDSATEPSPAACQLTEILAEPLPKPPAAGRAARSRRLVVRVGDGLWCLEPAVEEPGTVQSDPS